MKIRRYVKKGVKRYGGIAENIRLCNKLESLFCLKEQSIQQDAKLFYFKQKGECIWIRTRKDNLEGYYFIEVRKNWLNNFFAKGGSLQELTLLITHDLFKIICTANCICGYLTAEKLFSILIHKFDLSQVTEIKTLLNGNLHFCTKKFKWTSLWHEPDYLLNGYF